jgi:Substrate binding domain of ABC-type glycine betaine transport system
MGCRSASNAGWISVVGLSSSDVQLIDLQPQAALAAWERGDVDAVYTWLPTLDELRKSGKTLITSRELATAGKPTLDLGVVSSSFAQEHPDVVDTWRKVETKALNLLNSDPQAAAAAIGPELGISADDAAGQLKQGVYLTEQQLTSADWLGADGAPGKRRAEPAERGPVPHRPEADPGCARARHVPEGALHQGATECPRQLRPPPPTHPPRPRRAAPSRSRA